MERHERHLFGGKARVGFRFLREGERDIGRSGVEASQMASVTFARDEHESHLDHRGREVAFRQHWTQPANTDRAVHC